MKTTCKARYAVMAAIDLAEQDGDGPVSLADISARQEISLAYLEQLFCRLRRAGVVCSVRGPGGGYMLCRPTEEISVADIVRAVGEQIRATGCTSDEMSCWGRETKCNSHDLWAALGEQVSIFLSSISLADLVAKKLPMPVAPMFAMRAQSFGVAAE